MSQLTRQEALNVLAKGESTSQTLQEQTCWSKIAQDGINLPGINKNIKYVQSDQTIQSVIDNCPVAVGSLKEGFTNSQIVNVPPGHEKEYYSLVRDVSDAASDKRNIKVVFQDNPEGKFIIDDFDDMSSGWTTWDGTIEFVPSSYCLSDKECMHLYKTGSDSGISLIASKDFGPTDLTAYQGMLLNITIPHPENCENSGNHDEFRVQGRNVNGTETDFLWLGPAASVSGAITTTIFVPFIAGTPTFDMTELQYIKFLFRRVNATTPFDVYISNIRMVKTFQTDVAVLRVDDSASSSPEFLYHIAEKGWGCSCSLYDGEQVKSGLTTGLDLQTAKALYSGGFEFVNETRNHCDFLTTDKAETEYQIKSNMLFLLQYGFSRGANILLNPYHRTNNYVFDFFKTQGGVQFSGFHFFPSKLVYCDGDEGFPTNEMQLFVDYSRGGVAQIMIHFRAAAVESEFIAALDYVETHFSHVYLASDVLKRYPTSFYEYKEPKKDYNFARTVSFAADDTIWDMDGNTIRATATNVGLKLIPVYEFEQKQLIILNEGANSFIFDPTFTAAGNHDGLANAATLTDSGESWTRGQLVGRTLTNTPDGSSGIVTENTATTVTAVLTGGTSNNWQIGEAYTITPAGLNQTIAATERGQFVYNGAGWDKIFLA